MNSRVEKRYFLKGKLREFFILKESILQAFQLIRDLLVPFHCHWETCIRLRGWGFLVELCSTVIVPCKNQKISCLLNPHLVYPMINLSLGYGVFSVKMMCSHKEIGRVKSWQVGYVFRKTYGEDIWHWRRFFESLMALPSSGGTSPMGC